jgi:very-short-patch-repair endonuclease
VELGQGDISAGLSHGSAAALWGIARENGAKIEVTVRGPAPIRRPGLRVHRRRSLPPGRFVLRQGIPVTDPVQTLLDLAGVPAGKAPRLGAGALERMVNEADRLDLEDPEALRAKLAERRGEPGVARLRALLDRHTFRLTDSELERRFLALVRRAGLPAPLTRRWVNGFRVDFFWPELGLVVETDGLRYHRTPAEQARDLRRDRAHAAAGLTTLRFTHLEVTRDSNQVSRMVADTVARLRGSRARQPAS